MLYTVAFLKNGKIVIKFKVSNSKEDVIKDTIKEENLKDNIFIEAKQINPNISYKW